ncbi:pyridoxamine 5'-phosphate oxidase family protein [Serinicoccus chungangensis]|uniref:pyridoxamine 5'-phosphate oxidase family protein n=1 Tax=Serinicoccus chungangensis TaxID=767452 RepID=UPI001910F491|nr:pyridoxamine 5'-phosphate oxidase family protein [Serinicoccus chungangensis]
MDPTFDIAGFLREPRRPASVSTVTASGRPALATMWFGFFGGRFWFHTPIAEKRPSPFLLAASQGREVAAMVATFDPPTDVRQVRVTGPAILHPHDPARARAIYCKYVSDWTDS